MRAGIRTGVVLLASCALFAACQPDEASRPRASEPISLAELSNLTIPLEGGKQLRLKDGRARIGYGGASADNYSLAGFFADGRIAGSPGAAVVLVRASAGSGVFLDVVAARRTADGLVASEPFPLGDRVPVQSISISSGKVHATFLDRGVESTFREVEEQVTVTLAAKASALVEVDRDTVPLTEVPLPKAGPEPRTLSGLADGITQRGEIEYGQVQAYDFDAAKGQALTAELDDAPLGLFLSVHSGSTYLTKPTDRITRFRGILPADRTWTVDVISLNGHTSPYVLSLDLDGPPDSGAATRPRQPSPSTASPRGKVAYLTFDDGPSPTHTRQVLDVLERHGAKATFFVLGSQAQAHPDLVDAIAAGGHTFGNHTWAHRSLAGMSKREFDQEVKPAKRLLGRHDTDCLRPPYGAKDGYTAQYAAALGYRLTLWDIDPRDWARPGVPAIVREVTRNIRPGSVILLHDAGGDRSQTVAALNRLLPRLVAQGWRFEALC